MDELFGIGADPSRALPLADEQSGVRQVRRDSSISLDDPSDTVRQHHSRILAASVPEDDEERPNVAGQQSDISSPLETQISDKPFQSSPTEGISLSVSELCSNLDPSHPLGRWVEYRDNRAWLVGGSYDRSNDSLPRCELSTVNERSEDGRLANPDSDGADDTVSGVDSGQGPAAPYRDGLQTPKTWTPGSVTPHPSAHMGSEGSEGSQPDSPIPSEHSARNMSSNDDDGASYPSGSAMSDIILTTRPSAAEEHDELDIQEDPEGMHHRGRGYLRYRRYVAQRGAGRRGSELMSQRGRNPTAGYPDTTSRKDEEAQDGQE